MRYFVFQCECLCLVILDSRIIDFEKSEITNGIALLSSKPRKCHGLEAQTEAYFRHNFF
jgi:hypothetical protein